MKKFTALLLAFCLALSFAGCGEEKKPDVIMAATAVTAPLVESADPATALKKIYQNVDILGLEEANEKDLKEIFNLDTSLVDEFYVRFASGRFGVADVFILKPVEDQGPALRQELEAVKDLRKNQFENYDIYNAYQIAQEAPIYEQGDYLILLMLEDVDTARTIIDQYIPKT